MQTDFLGEFRGVGALNAVQDFAVFDEDESRDGFHFVRVAEIRQLLRLDLGKEENLIREFEPRLILKKSCNLQSSYVH